MTTPIFRIEGPTREDAMVALLDELIKQGFVTEKKTLTGHEFTVYPFTNEHDKIKFLLSIGTTEQ